MNDLRDHDSFLLLEFSEDWIKLNLIDFEILERLKAEYKTSSDKNAEHYRWGVFKQFLEANNHMSEPLFFALYDLGNNDTDRSMGESMMIELVRRQDCPAALIESASKSGRKSLARIAAKRLIGGI